MRKLLAVAAMAAIALGAAAACTTAPTDPSPSSTSAPAGDATQAVCAEAVPYAGTASANVLAKYNEGAQAVAANDLAKAQQAALAGKALLTEWSTKFKGLSAQPIKPEVKAALDAIAAFADQTAVATTADPVAVQAQFATLSATLTSACAA